MPRISDRVLDCVVYLYRSIEEAAEGRNVGASGFLLGCDTEKLGPPAAHIYAVTNRHVVDQGFTKVRLNTKAGGLGVCNFEVPSWFCSDTDDLAVVPMPDVADDFKIHAIPRASLISEQFLSEHGVGVGDELLLLGRFINRDGRQQNTPTARFGNIAQMPDEPIEIEFGGRVHQQEAFLAELRSVSGHSGSPVYLFPNPTYARPGKQIPADRACLLGVDFCHIETSVQVTDADGRRFKVKSNSGMAGVVPAWKLETLLDSEPLRKQRVDAEAAELERRKGVATKESNAT